VLEIANHPSKSFSLKALNPCRTMATVSSDIVLGLSRALVPRPPCQPG
jgi:hypothetical protein